jgi:hypothetical protein
VIRHITRTTTPTLTPAEGFDDLTGVRMLKINDEPSGFIAIATGSSYYRSLLARGKVTTHLDEIFESLVSSTTAGKRAEGEVEFMGVRTTVKELRDARRPLLAIHLAAKIVEDRGDTVTVGNVLAEVTKARARNLMTPDELRQYEQLGSARTS